MEGTPLRALSPVQGFPEFGSNCRKFAGTPAADYVLALDCPSRTFSSMPLADMR